MYSIRNLLILCVVSYTSAQCLTENDSRPANNSLQQNDALYEGQQEFSLAMLKEINKQDRAASIFFSPYSTYNALLLAYFIAKTHTEESIKYALRVPANQDKIDVLQSYNLEKYIRLNKEDGSYEFASANRIYITNETGIRPCMQELLGDELESLDFKNNPEAARIYINDWVKNVTKNQIENILPDNSIDSNTNTVLANAAYFKGQWVSKFEPLSTKKTVFYISGSEKTFVNMMYQEAVFNHDVSETLGAHVLELPYVGNDISMYIFLPPFATDAGIENVLEKLNASTFQEVISENNLYPKKVFVALPKFEMEQTIELVPVLEALGVGDLFSQTSDLSGLTGEKNLDLGRAIHKAKIEVNEEGTKAAAATVFFTFRSSRPVEPAMFICNHPFIYVIFDKTSQNIIFSGVFRKP